MVSASRVKFEHERRCDDERDERDERAERADTQIASRRDESASFRRDACDSNMLRIVSSPRDNREQILL